MTAPQLTQFEPGSPATSLSADQLNTLMQSCDNFTQMRAFVGAPGQSLFARGAVTIGDGQQGIFYWASGSVYTDDGVNTIVPTLAFRGAWVRLTSISPSSGTYLQTVNNLSDVPSKSTAVANLFASVSSFSLGQHIATQNIATVTGQGGFAYGTLSYTDSGLPLSLQGSLNGYVQAVVQNSNSGAAASADFIVSNNLGTASTYYGDFGINSSTFSGAGSFSLPNATYLYAANGDLVLGTYTSNAIHFVANNGATDAMQISAAGVVSFTTPVAVTSGGTGSAVATGAQSNLQYLTGATGGAARTYLSKFGDVSSVKDFGAKGDGTTDDTAAVQAAITAGGAIYFPPGTYKLSSQITYTMPSGFASISIFGAGAEVTKLVWAAGGGMQINHIGQYNSTRVRDLCFQTSSTNVGTGLILYQTVGVANPADSAPSEVSNCIFRGSDAYAGTYYWAVACQAYSVSNVNFNGCGFFGSNADAGIGVLLSSISGAYPGAVYNFQSCFFNFINYGIDYGNYVQGVTVNQCNFTGAQQGIVALAGLSALDQLVVTNSQFECSINGILTATIIPNTQIMGCLFIVGLAANGTGINLQTGGAFSIVGNCFNPLGTPTSATGVSVGATGSSLPGVITGNVFYGMSNAGIVLGASSNHVNVQSNVYVSNGTNISNSGASNTLGGGST